MLIINRKGIGYRPVFILYRLSSTKAMCSIKTTKFTRHKHFILTTMGNLVNVPCACAGSVNIHV